MHDHPCADAQVGAAYAYVMTDAPDLPVSEWRSVLGDVRMQSDDREKYHAQRTHPELRLRQLGNNSVASVLEDLSQACTARSAPFMHSPRLAVACERLTLRLRFGNSWQARRCTAFVGAFEAGLSKMAFSLIAADRLCEQAATTTSRPCRHQLLRRQPWPPHALVDGGCLAELLLPTPSISRAEGRQCTHDYCRYFSIDAPCDPVSAWSPCEWHACQATSRQAMARAAAGDFHEQFIARHRSQLQQTP